MGSVIRTCSVLDCDNIHLARGVCNKHYHVWKNIQLGYEDILPYIEEIKDPIICKHLVSGGKFRMDMAGNGRLFRRCLECEKIRRLNRDAINKTADICRVTGCVEKRSIGIFCNEHRLTYNKKRREARKRKKDDQLT
jgi:hypothetical protein